MNSSRIPLLALATLAIAAFAAPAAAQSNRTWVSRNGSDNSATCSIAAPCATFASAIFKTNAGGLISCLDSGEFMPSGFNITKSITIKCTGVMASIVSTGNVAIGIAAGPTDKIVLDGLDIDGLGQGVTGITTVGTGTASKVHVLNTSIRNFTSGGIELGSSNIHLFLDNSFLIGNATGVRVTGTNNIASLTNSSVRANPTASLDAGSTSAIIGVQNSVINDSPVAIKRLGAAQVISVGPSNLITGAGSFTSVIPFQ